MDPTSPNEALTIEQLAEHTGMTERDIRAWQTRGLLPPPRQDGGTPYYGAEHVRRLLLTAVLQKQGFNLASIKCLLDTGTDDPELVRLYGAALRHFEIPRDRMVVQGELAEAFGPIPPPLIERAERIGLLERLDDGRLAVRSRALLEAGRELFRLGVPLDELLTVMERLREHTAAAASTFVELMLERSWQPFEEAGRPAEQWPQIHGTAERLAPLVSACLVAVFQATMSERVQRAFGEMAGGPTAPSA
jgi:DNA-binding transcriptional MerR regulator